MTLSLIPRVAAIGLVLGTLGACNPYVWGGAAVATVPNAVTGRNVFYTVDKYFGRRCSDTTYFDRPVRCVNDPD